MLHPSGGGDGPGGLGQLHGQLPPLQPHVEAVQDHVPEDVPLAGGEKGIGRLAGSRQEGKPQPAAAQGRIFYGKGSCLKKKKTGEILEGNSQIEGGGHPAQGGILYGKS